jgi:protein-tyrosine phosphatase
MAEFVFKDMVKKKGLEHEFHIESRATHTDEIWNGQGSPVYPPARAKLAEVGISCKGKHAQLLTKSDYKDFDYIIGMDSENARWMPRILGGDREGKISLLLDYTDHPRSVADPWYTGNFEVTYDDIVEGCEGFIEYLGNNGKI